MGYGGGGGWRPSVREGGAAPLLFPHRERSGRVSWLPANTGGAGRTSRSAVVLVLEASALRPFRGDDVLLATPISER